MAKDSVLMNSRSFQVWQSNNSLQRQLKQILQPCGLSYVQYVLLSVLVYDLNKRAFNQAQLCERAGTDKNMTSAVLRSLEKKKLIFRRKGIIDGRAISLRPTARGEIVIDQATKAVAKADC